MLTRALPRSSLELPLTVPIFLHIFITDSIYNRVFSCLLVGAFPVGVIIYWGTQPVFSFLSLLAAIWSMMLLDLHLGMYARNTRDLELHLCRFASPEIGSPPSVVRRKMCTLRSKQVPTSSLWHYKAPYTRHPPPNLAPEESQELLKRLMSLLSSKKNRRKIR